MADEPEGFPPLPALTEPADPDEELRLEDALAEAPTVTVAQSPPVPLGRAPAYDFERHLLLPAAAGGPLMTRGVATLRTWIEKCIRTRRGEHPAVDPDFGLDLIAEDLLSEGVPYDPAALAEYAAAIERGLTAHPRIAGVDIDLEDSLDPDADHATITFTVLTVGDDLPELTFERLPVGG